MRNLVIAATCFVLLQGCMKSEIQGTYQVEIELVGITAPIEGTLIISTAILDVPAPTEQDRAMLGEWLEGGSIDANSCFILHANGDDKATPQNVRVFDARIRANEVGMPIEIYRTPLQHLEIVKLDFFANAIGGEVVLHDRGEQRAGRIHGFRAGQPKLQRCLDDLERFRVSLRSSLAP